ncbi:MAG: GTP-binding protein [Thermoproteota archaeon]|nr:GTP-binding protein [Thermoproteota archaeon]
MARNSDGLILIIDLSRGDLSEQLKMIIKELNTTNIIVTERRRKVEVEMKENGGMQVVCFGNFDGTPDNVKEIL